MRSPFPSSRRLLDRQSRPDIFLVPPSGAQPRAASALGLVRALFAGVVLPFLDRTASRRPRYLIHGAAALVVLVVIGVVVGQPRGSAAPPSTPQVAAPQPALVPVDDSFGNPRPTPTTAPEPTPTETSQKITSHTVEGGESLRMLAARYGVSPVAIMAANNITDPDLIHVGEELTIPPANGALYELRKGETLHDVAEKFGVDTSALVDANGLLSNPDMVMAGAQLVIPGVDPDKLAEVMGADGQRAASLKSKPVIPSTRTYEVQPGDTLLGIASTFGVDVPTILSTNGMSDPDLIKPGVELRILPVKGIEYTVQKGETLADIAYKYQVDMGLLLDYNDLDNPDVIRVGQKLVLPGGRLRADGGAAPKPQAPSTSGGAAAKPQAAAPQTVTGGAGGGVVQNAMKFAGYRYVFGGTSPAGFDCSGFVYYIHNITGYPVGRGMWQQLNGGPRISRDELRPGDTVFFANTYMAGLSHNGIYIGNGQFIHAADESTGVVVSSLNSAYWTQHYVGATRLW